jgi:hypothetical protein
LDGEAKVAFATGILGRTRASKTTRIASDSIAKESITPDALQILDE